MAEHRRIANLKGPQGDQGRRGALGPSPDIGIGEVTTVTDTSEAAARIHGPAATPLLDLDIPRGIPGPDVAPTDESVAAMVGTQGTDTYAAVRSEAAKVGREVLSTDGAHRVLTVNQAGQSLMIHGDPDQVSASSVASITKLLTCLVTCEVMRDNGVSFDTLLEVAEFDRNDHSSSPPGNRLQADDQVSVRNLLRLAIIPSDNVAPVTLARSIGGVLPDGHSSNTAAYNAFILRMNERAEEWGWRGASFSRPAGAGRMSARHVADAIWRAHDDEVLGPILAQETASIPIMGPNARTLQVQDTITTQVSESFPERLAYKGGTNHGRNHRALIWEAGGSKYATIVLDVRNGEPVNSWGILRNAMDKTIAGDDGMIQQGLTVASGPVETSTGQLDITSRFPSPVERTSTGGSGIYIQRDGAVVQFTIVAVQGFENSTVVNAIPAGFRPSPSAYGTTSPAAQSTTDRRVLVSGSGNVLIRESTAGAIHRLSMTWMTNDTFPSAPFPGIPAKRA